MKNLYILKTSLFVFFMLILASCGSESDDLDDYTPVPPVVINPVPEDSLISPVDVNLATVPYRVLSQYKFYEGAMKDLKPAYKVIPYDLNSTLFTDYAHKKRFVYMPEGAHASYNTDGTILNFPRGAVLIKNFYYDNVQPSNTTRIIETRLMIKTLDDDGWIFANYVWNEDQTEATLDLNGSFTNVTFVENGVSRNVNYRIPSEGECFTCHKLGDVAVPIGPKPQNLNKNYAYAEGSRNQLSRWIDEGYLTSAPENIVSAVDWTDASQPLELRVRSYLDINCAHCHSEGAHCSYRTMRFALSESTTPQNLGICMQPQEFINSSLTYIVAKRNPLRSSLYYRMNNVVESERMPLLGRTLIHTEAVDMVRDWINSLEGPCQ